ncbi:MAG TPA: hypothetical protein VLN59_02760 [Burkholderiales bacterium]|nr:hypothetical protein [Burkholderiales bacterium]
MWRTLALALCVMLSLGVNAQSRWEIIINSPANGETVHDNEGNVHVTLTMQGAGTLGIRPLVDGNPYGPDQRTSSFILANVDRGEHILQVQLIDAQGRVIAASEPVTFYLWRASVRFPSHKN